MLRMNKNKWHKTDQVKQYVPYAITILTLNRTIHIVSIKMMRKIMNFQKICHVLCYNL